MQLISEQNAELRKKYPFINKPHLLIIPDGRRKNKEEYYQQTNNARKQYLLQHDPEQLTTICKRWNDEFQN